MEAINSDRDEAVVRRARAAAAAWMQVREATASGRWALFVVYLGAAWLITQLYWELTDQLHTATIEKMVAGEADSPFAYRVLMPMLLAIAAGANGIHDLELVDVGLRVAVLFGLMVGLRHWLRYFVEPLLADIMPLLLGVVLPWSFHFYWPYDFSGVLIWTACLIALMERRYGIYLALFAVGTFNRETSFFLMGIFAATQWDHLGRREALAWTGRQLLVWLLIVVGLRLSIPASNGEPVEIHLLENLGYLVHGLVGVGPVGHWLRVFSALGFLWLLAPWHWRKKALFLRRACWVLPIHAAVLLVVGRLVETRLWYEWIPIVMALAGQTLMEFSRREPRPAGTTATPM